MAAKIVARYNLSEAIKTFSLSLCFASIFSLLVFITGSSVSVFNLFLISATYSSVTFTVPALNPFASILFLVASLFFYKMGNVAYDAKV